ncbi:MAG: hypothetical protein FK731_02865, partial [Asgard group archaeon]|nr:hypothetical protein [Asgard group archaeon]
MSIRKKIVTITTLLIFSTNFLSIITNNYVASISDCNISIDDYIFSTYLGGSGEDLVHNSIIDSNDNIIIAGVTSSENYPTINAYQENYNGGGDSFISKISSDGQEIIFSTFLGGSDLDIVSSVKLDNYGNIVVTGFTYSSNFPTLNPIQAELNGTSDIFISKFNPDGILLYSTFFGGSGLDTGRDLTYDSNNNYILTGHTTSSDFPITNDAFQDSFGGGTDDAFILQLAENGQTVLYSTFLGDDGIDGGTQIIIDNQDCVAFCGTTNSTEFNTTIDAYQTTFNGGINDCFIAFFNLTNKEIIYSTLIGGNENEMPWDITFDNNFNLIITGYTHSSNFPTSVDAFQIIHGGNDDIFVLKLNSNDYSLNFSTFLGGSNNEYGKDLKIDGCGNVLVIGNSESPNYPISSNAFQATIGGYNDIIFSALDSKGQNLTYSTFIGSQNYDNGNGLSLDQEFDLIITGSSDSTNFHLEDPLQDNNAGLYDNLI